MSQYTKLSGETRVIAIIGDPIAQVKSPAGVTQALLDQGRNALVVPFHIKPADLDQLMQGIKCLQINARAESHANLIVMHAVNDFRHLL